ncbi:MAG: hypothetical protein HOE36_07385 [Flavobacteriaceae bacterium]|jgi:hypothetical protein|nr:hypothetical protein [Flavobacteriaceae bacterium]
MVTKRHKRGRLSSEIDRNRVGLAEQNGKVSKKRKLVTHRINYYAMNNNITQDGTQVFIHTGDFEEE